MQLVMIRERLTPTEAPFFRDLLASFKINARFVLEKEEEFLIDRYSLHTVNLTPGNPPRDRRKSLFYAGPVAVLAGLWIFYFTVLSMPAAILLALLIFFILWFLIYQQIREAVRVSDLLTGRNFKARSLLQLLVTENRIRKMSGVFAIVLEQART